MSEALLPLGESADVNQRLRTLEETQRATLNILEDYDEERRHSQLVHKATMNLLEDMYEEQRKLADTQRALLNILEDIEVERAKSRLRSAPFRLRGETVRWLGNGLQAFRWSSCPERLARRPPLKS